jgi:tetratricopeptide (TPR) repeat protein
MAPETLTQAMQYHAAGDFGRAEQLYRQILETDPHQVDVWFYLGDMYLVTGRLQDAMEYYYYVLKLAPSHSQAQNSLGIAFAQQNNWGDAVYWFQQSVQSKPDHAEAYNNLGIALANQGNLTEAENCYREAIRLKGEFPAAYNNLGLVLTTLGRFSDAIASYHQALAQQPNYFEARHNLGQAFEKAKRYEEAIDCYRQVLCDKPDYPEAHNSLGNSLYKLGRYAESKEEFSRALSLRPNYGEAYHNLANLVVDEGRPEEGIDNYNRALQYMPDRAEVHVGRAFTWLRMGDFARGCPEFEWRWHLKGVPPRSLSQPRWDGSPLNGQRIFLHAEQGLGDTIQFVRYVPLVKALGGRVIVGCQESVRSLVATCAGIDELISGPAPVLPPFDTHAALMSLPWIMGTTLSTIPAKVPYLSADPQVVEHWRKEMSAIPGFKIGIAWQGNPEHVNDYHRSVPLARFETLARMQGVRLLSLQKGTGFEQLAAVIERWPIPDLGSRFRTFTDTAAALKNLDLVITVDSAVAHCAGALAVPIWVLLPFAADWRWLTGRDDSPWYPTMRLFRQPKVLDWDTVFERLVAGVKERMAAKAKS